MRRLLGVLVALALVAGVAVVVWRTCCAGSGVAPPVSMVTLHGVIGSEKSDFFRDADVQKALRAKGLVVDTASAGSLEMSDQSLSGDDFAFPASSVVANDIRGLNPVPVRPFYSPLVIVARQSTAKLLLDNQLASESSSGVWTFRMGAYLADLQHSVTWESLSGAANDPALRGLIFVTTTDPASSSSGALHLAVMSYLANGGKVVSDQAGVNLTAPLLRHLTEIQGAQLPSTDGPFRNFVSGVGNPLVWVYESQVAAEASKGTLPPDTVLLYPDTTFLSDHTLVELTPAASALAVALRDDPKLQNLEARLGFRPSGDPTAFGRAMATVKTKGFAPDLSQAGVAQVAIPATSVMRQLVVAAEGTG
ncbi:hypothetical protein P3T37_001933 [Kitasatospora sp. MAA4]|uniref:hypothetical protein n=1 Tax=Kitasatospora sp. MAA4 TaxID=3035093 RepID=UPI002476F540|nr:hypothetical protein [Kitasatospora sp. MAA4]MDH6132548.1 hypothetical protein [Kitasatospora sp. MAA4]